MLMALDVGNSQVFGGIFNKGEIIVRFRKTTKSGLSSDEFGIFFRDVLRENNLPANGIRQIAICSVVPDLVHSLKNACKKYFDINPFLLQVGFKTGLRVCYHSPAELGSDRIANAVAANHLFPGKNLIVVDLGTATKFCAVSKNKEHLGGVIVAGLRLSMEALESKTAKLPAVEIVPVSKVLGRSTVEGIQSGLYYGHLGTMREIIGRIAEECFAGETPLVIGTGGFSSLFENQKIFDTVQPDLVLKGLAVIFQMNEREQL